MPFQDEDEVSTEAIRAPSSVEKFVRKVFVEDWSLKLLSLAIALMLWLVVTSQNEPVTTHVSVQLNFVRPQSLDIGNDPPRTVDVTLTGSRSKLDNLSALDMVATIDITDQKAGERVWRLADKAQISLPQGVKVDSFLPGAITVRLEQIIERQLPVVPKVEGSPAEGYEVYSATPEPGAVTVRGPESRVNALDKAPTEAIRLTGLKDSFNTAEIVIDISDPKVDLVDSHVKVHVELGERRVEKSFVDVPITTQSGIKVEPRLATVSLLGPPRLLEELKKEDIKLVIDSGGSEPRLELPSALQGKVILKSIKPSKFIRSS
jgi:YbbR domain-containing protein